jgi:hypothetical protein
MKKIKLNKDFKIDNKLYSSGIIDVPLNHYEMMKKLDINGVELITNSGQTPLVTEIENSNAKPDKV